MKLLKYFLVLVTFTLVSFITFTYALPPDDAVAGTITIIQGDPQIQVTQQYYVTGTGTIGATFSLANSNNVSSIELVSIRLHLSGAGGSGSFTAAIDSHLGAAYDTVIYTKDMTAATDACQMYVPEEAILDNESGLTFAWTAGNQVTYGLELIYKLR